MTHPAEMNKSELLQAYLRALMHGDRELFEQILSPDFTLGLPQPSNGALTMDREAAIDFLSTAPGRFFDTSSFVFEQKAVVDSGRDYIVEMNISAKAQNGANYDNLYVLWFTVADGKIHALREHLDTAYALKALSPEA